MVLQKILWPNYERHTCTWLAGSGNIVCFTCLDYLLGLFLKKKKTFKDSCSTQQCHSVQFIHTEKCCHVKMSFWCMLKKIVKIKQSFNLNHNHRIKNSKYDSSIKTKRENIFKDLFNHYFLTFCCLKTWCI